MTRCSLAASLLLAGLATFVVGQVGDPSKGKGTPPQITLGKDGKPVIDTKELAKVEKALSEKYSAFEKSLLTLVQRLSNGDDKDKVRSAQLQRVLDTATGNNITSKFTQFIKFLSQQQLGNTGEIDEAVRQSVALAKDLKEILDLLRNDNGAGSKREERIALEKWIEELERNIRDEKLIRSQIPTNPDKEAVGNDQRDVTQTTADLKNKLPGKGGEAGEPKDSKGEAKPGGKGEKADAKNLGKENEEDRISDAKPPGEKGGQAKPSSDSAKKDAQGGAKDSKGSDSAKAGDAKDSKGSDSKAGTDKSADSAKAGQAKDVGNKDAQAKAEKQGTAKGPEIAAKEKDEQAGMAKKAADPEVAKAGESKTGENPKAEQSKPGQTPSSAGKSKPGSDSKSQGASKSASGEPSDKQPEAAGGKTDNQPTPKGANKSEDDYAKAKKRLEEANWHQKSAEDHIAKSKKEEASKAIDKAIDNLERVKKDMEKLLRQLREEELERVLANLISRCQKMLAMQEEVLRGTLRVQSQIEATPSKQADRDSILASLNLSDDELKIVYEASKAIEILETEGSAVAFPEVFQQVREDMKHVQRRLKNTDVGDVTVAIEQDITDTLREMIKALEKAKKEMEEKKNQPKEPKESQKPPQQDQKLLNQIAELKILRSMQLLVNTRTELYGKRYQGEQAMTDDIRLELRDLAGRQERIWDVTTKMAKGGG